MDKGTDLQVQSFRLGHQANGSGLRHVLVVDALHHPVQHATVFAESWPQELSVLVLTEPVHVEDLGEFILGVLAEGEPMVQVFAEVVAEERAHGEGVVHQQRCCNKVMHSRRL